MRTGALAAIACLLCASPAFGSIDKRWPSPPDGAPRPGTREVPWVHVVSLHTGDSLPVFGDRIPAERLAHVLRCRATGLSMPIADPLPRLLVRAAKRWHSPVIEIVAGFRSDKFNEQLRKKGRGVADESFHRLGRAIDWRLRGIPLNRLYRYLRQVHRGGLGRYPTSNFLHTDTGPPREWRGR